EEQKRAAEFEDQLLEERKRCARRLENFSAELLEEKAKNLELRKPRPLELQHQAQEAKLLAELNEAKRQTRAYERGWKQAMLDAKDLESLLTKERQQRQLFSDFVEDLEKRCWMVQKDLRLQNLPEVLATERQQRVQVTQRAVDFEDRCEKLQKSIDDLSIYTEKLSIESANGTVALRRANELEDQYDQLCSYAESLEQELRRSKRTMMMLDDSCAGLEQKLADQTTNAVEVLAGRLKVKLRYAGLRCFFAWHQWLILEKAQKWREAEAARILEESEAHALRLQGRALSAFRISKHRAIGLENVGEVLFHYRMKIMQVHLFMSWRLHCKAETFSKAWYKHKTEIQEGRQQAIRQALEEAEAVTLEETMPAIPTVSDIQPDAGEEEPGAQIAALHAVQEAAAQDAHARALRRADEEAELRGKQAQGAADRLRLAQLEAREWLAAVEAAKLQLHSAQTAGGGKSPEDLAQAVEEAAEYLREVEAAKARADEEVEQLKKAAEAADLQARTAKNALEQARQAAASLRAKAEARATEAAKVAARAKAAADAERRAQQRSQAEAKRKEAEAAAAKVAAAKAAAKAAEAEGAAAGSQQVETEEAQDIDKRRQEDEEARQAEEKRLRLEKEAQQVERRRLEEEEAKRAEEESRARRKEEEARRAEEKQRRRLEEEARRAEEELRRRLEEEARQAEQKRREKELEEERHRKREEELERDRQKAEELADRMQAEMRKELLNMCVEMWQEVVRAAAAARQREEAKRKHEEEVKRMKEEAVAKAERVADSVAEKMYRQLCEELLKEIFDEWHQEFKKAAARRKEELAKKQYEEEKQRLHAAREAEALKAREAQEAHEAQMRKMQEEASERERQHAEAERQALELQRQREVEQEAMQRAEELRRAEALERERELERKLALEREAERQRELQRAEHEAEARRQREVRDPEALTDLQLRREREAREALEVQQREEREALQRQRDELERQRQAVEREAAEALRREREEVQRQRDAAERAEREALQRQQQLASVEREALVEQIKVARQQQTFEMELLREQVARAEDDRRTQQVELQRLKEEVTKGSVYQEILQQIKLTPATMVTQPPESPVAVHEHEPSRRRYEVYEASATQTADVTTRSISVEAVPELPARPARPSARAMELGQAQADMLERMLLKAVLRTWQAAVDGLRPSESRVREVPWQTPEELFLPPPRSQNWALSAAMAARGLEKWSEETETEVGPLNDMDLYEASARAHATFATWAVSSSKRHMRAAFGQPPEQSPEDQAAEEAVQRASQWISQDVNQELEQIAMQPLSSWPPPLLPPKPILPGDFGWEDRVQRVAQPRRRLFGEPAENEEVEDVFDVQSDGLFTSFRPAPREGTESSTSEFLARAEIGLGLAPSETQPPAASPQRPQPGHLAFR
ncbi:unnamed protein product, partial [Effrenium voratum]